MAEGGIEMIVMAEQAALALGDDDRLMIVAAAVAFDAKLVRNVMASIMAASAAPGER